MRFLVADLVERFDRDREVFLSPDYKEEQLRVAADGSLLTAYSLRLSDSDSGPSAASRWPLALAIGSLYYPDCPYEFSVLPADILGQVYEQFLGKVIRLTAGHQAKVEEKPEVRKAGGLRLARLTSARSRHNMRQMSDPGRPSLTGTHKTASVPCNPIPR